MKNAIKRISQSITTRLLRLCGKYLFVNIDMPEGELRAEALDAQGNPIKPLHWITVYPVKGNSTKLQASWQGGSDLSELGGMPVMFRFQLKMGGLYSFWVSSDQEGSSNGFNAAGSL